MVAARSARDSEFGGRRARRLVAMMRVTNAAGVRRRGSERQRGGSERPDQREQQQDNGRAALHDLCGPEPRVRPA